MFLVMGASMFGMSALLRQYREIVFPVTLMLRTAAPRLIAYPPVPAVFRQIEQ